MADAFLSGQNDSSFGADAPVVNCLVTILNENIFLVQSWTSELCNYCGLPMASTCRSHCFCVSIMTCFLVGGSVMYGYEVLSFLYHMG